MALFIIFLHSFLLLVLRPVSAATSGISRQHNLLIEKYFLNEVVLFVHFLSYNNAYWDTRYTVSIIENQILCESRSNRIAEQT